MFKNHEQQASNQMGYTEVLLWFLPYSRYNYVLLGYILYHIHSLLHYISIIIIIFCLFVYLSIFFSWIFCIEFILKSLKITQEMINSGHAFIILLLNRVPISIPKEWNHKINKKKAFDEHRRTSSTAPFIYWTVQYTHHWWGAASKREKKIT